jgi:nucleoside-diphosphate-sugar epimerase
VCNLATAIPPYTKAMRARAWAVNERIRTEGSTAVVDAALTSGVGRVVQESITFTYPDRGDEWIDESVALDVPALGFGVATAEANAERFTEAGGAGVVLRFGLFYGPDSTHSDTTLAYARRHVGFVTGPGSAYQSSIHLEDAGRAVVAALTAPSGVYNVCDDEPVTKKDYAIAAGAAVGRKPWILMPGRAVALGGKKADILRRSQRVNNQAFRAATGWAPRYASVRQGWPAVAAATKREGITTHA